MQTVHQASEGRSDVADLCKALGIVLVVWGHVPGIPNGPLVLIYSFHMPLFFFLSGYLLRTERMERGLSVQAWEAARTLLRPYVFFFALSLVYWMATRNIGSRAQKFVGVGMEDAVAGFFTGLSSDLFVNQALWFFPCMFFVQMLYRLAWRWLPNALGLAAASFGIAMPLLVFTLPWNARLPWGLDIAWVALVFFSAGRLAREASIVQRLAAGSCSARRAILSLLVMIPAWVLCSMVQGRVDLAVANFGPGVPLYFLTAFLGVAVAFVVCSQLRCIPALRWLAQNTLLIFPLHTLFINFGSGLAKFAGVGLYGLPASLLFTVWGIVCTIPAAWILKRYFAFMLGMPPARGGAAA